MTKTDAPITVEALKAQAKRVMEAVHLQNVDCSIAHSHVLASVRERKIELKTAMLPDWSGSQALQYANREEMRLCLGCSLDPDTSRLHMWFSLGYKTPGDCAYNGPMDNITLLYLAVRRNDSWKPCFWAISATPRSVRAQTLVQRLDKGLLYSDNQPCVILPARIRKKPCHEPHNHFYLSLVDRMLACFLDPPREPLKISL